MRLIVVVIIIFFSVSASSQALRPFHIDTLWGYKDDKGLIKIEPQFQVASPFQGNVAVVAKNEKFGVISEDGHLIIPFSYDFLSILDTTEVLFGYRTQYLGGHTKGVMMLDGKIKIPAEYNTISKYPNLYLVTKERDSIIGKNSSGDFRSVRVFHGLLDSYGNVLISCSYHHIRWISDNLLVVDSSYLTTDNKGLRTKSAIFNKKGNRLTRFDFAAVGNFVNGLAKVRIDDKYGFISPAGVVSIPVRFSYCEDFQDGVALFQEKDRWGAIDKEGRIIILPKFTYDGIKEVLEKRKQSL